MDTEHDPLQPHSHDPNPEPPSDDPDFTLSLPDGTDVVLTVAMLRELPATTVSNCYIVSTGHGTSGPFAFTGVRLTDLIAAHDMPAATWSHVEVISADGFGTRLTAEDLREPADTRPIVLAYAIDGEPMTREQGLVRLVDPTETDDALRQIKWVGQINVRHPHFSN